MGYRLYLEWNDIQVRPIIEEPRNQILNYLQDGPDIAFVREELTHVPVDTKVLPDKVCNLK